MDINILSDYFKKATEILPKGAFLTTKDGDKINTMTIGWGSFGFEWGMPVAEVMIRESRFSKLAADKNLEFTLTFPYDSSMKEALAFCGSKSGRDVDKIKECNIPILPGKKTATPVVACKGLVFECKVVARTEMKDALTSSDILNKWYKNGDLHTFYYASIEDCYEI
ncbi:MAG: flavin reductase family protein [Ruminococcaceae bacterium]|nr:flavin reductase family protein [Oscillospiraceae bacterium]